MTALSRPKNLTPKRNSFWDCKKHRKTSAERWTFSLVGTDFDIYNPSVTLRVPPSLTQGRHCRRSRGNKRWSPRVFRLLCVSVLLTEDFWKSVPTTLSARFARHLPLHREGKMLPQLLSAHKALPKPVSPNFQLSIFNCQFELPPQSLSAHKASAKNRLPCVKGAVSFAD